VGQSLVAAIGLEHGVGERDPPGPRQAGRGGRNGKGDDESRATQRGYNPKAGRCF
jgi:hypothetical protein